MCGTGSIVALSCLHPLFELFEVMGAFLWEIKSITGVGEGLGGSMLSCHRPLQAKSREAGDAAAESPTLLLL